MMYFFISSGYLLSFSSYYHIIEQAELCTLKSYFFAMI